MVQPHRFLGVVQQRQDFSVHIAADVKIAIDKGFHQHQRAEFVVVPILDHQRRAVELLCLADLFGCRFFEIEQIGPVAARADLAGAVDHIGLAQAALDQALPVRQKLGVRHINALRARLINRAGQGDGIFAQIVALLVLIGFGGGQRIAHHGPHPIREPAFKPDVDRQPREDRNTHRRDQRHQREHPRQTQHKGGDEQDVDQIDQQNDAQAGGVSALFKRAEHQIGDKRQHRPQNHKPQGRQIAHAPDPAQALKPHKIIAA